MKKKDRIIAWIAGLGVVAFIIKGVSAQAPPDKGKLNLTSNPSYASVSVNGTHIGNTPTSTEVEPGPYSVLMQKSGYDDWSVGGTILGGETKNIPANLVPSGNGGQPGKGNVDGLIENYDTRYPVQDATVVLSPGGYTEYTDNQGRYIARDIPVGSYSIRATAPGFFSSTKPRVVDEGRTVTCNFLLRPETQRTGHFKVKVYNSVTGEQMGNIVIRVETIGYEEEKRTSGFVWTYFRDLVVGELYSVSANYPGFRTWHDTFVVYPDATTKREVYLVPQ